ncbi:MAG: aminoacyl-tRNA hydrolase [Patescibacteria group bacterium]
MYIIVGLGNPGEEYENNRHNVGWIVLDFILGKKNGKNIEWHEVPKKAKTFFYKDSVAKKSVEYLKPLTFMNKSGSAVLSSKEKNKVSLEHIIVIHDDIDLPLGKIKLSFNRSSGGHNGLNSIIKSLKSQEFLRIRIGIAPVTPSGKIKKPKGEEAVLKFLLGNFKKDELEKIKKLSKKVAEALEIILSDGREKAMSVCNQ